MSRSETHVVLRILASILWRCFVVAIVSLMFSFTVYRLASDEIHRLYSAMSDVPPEDFARITLTAYAGVKILSVVAFLFPFLGIQWYLFSQRSVRQNGSESVDM